MIDVEQIELEIGIEAHNIRKIIENMSESIHEILGPNKDSYKNIVEAIIETLEETGLPVDITLSQINSSKYLSISSEKEEGVFAKVAEEKALLLCRNIKSRSPALKDILEPNEESINFTVEFFFSSVLENIKKALTSFPQDEQKLIFDYLFFRLANIDYYYNLLKDSLVFCKEVGFNIRDENKIDYFFESFFEDFELECKESIDWGNRNSLSSSLKTNYIKKLIKKCDKNSDIEIIKLENKKVNIRKKLLNIWNIFYLINGGILNTGEEANPIELKEIGLYGSCLPLSLLLKTIKDGPTNIDFGEDKEKIEKLLCNIEKNLVKINQYDFLLGVGGNFFLENPQQSLFMEEAGINISKKQLECVSKASKEIINLETYINNYLLRYHNVSIKQVIPNRKIYNERNMDIATINKSLNDTEIENNKVGLVSYYLLLSTDKKELMLKLIKEKTFLIINNLDLIKYIFNKNISIDIKENLLMKINKKNIDISYNTLFSCVENEKMEFLSTIYVHYWEKVSKLSIADIKKIKIIKKELQHYNILGRVTDIIDNISESEIFVSNMKQLEKEFKNIDYLFENEVEKIKIIKLDTDVYIDYINGEKQEYIKEVSRKLQQNSILIKNRKTLGLSIVGHKNFSYIKEEFGEEKLYDINREIINFMLNLDKTNIDFMLYLLMNYGVRKTNKLDIKQLNTIIENKDEIEIINAEEIENFIYNVINENSQERIENEQEKMIFKILELCENGNKALDLDIDIDHLYTKSKRWLYLCINLLEKIININKTEVVTMLILFDYNQLKNILKVYEILDSFDKDYEFYQLFIYDNLGKEQFIDKKMITNLLEKIDKLSYRKIIGNNNFVQDLIDFLTIKKDISFLLKKYSKSTKEKDIFTIDEGGHNRTESIINKIIKGDLSNIRLKGIVKSQAKIVEAIKQVKDLDFIGLDIKKMIVKNGFYRLKIDDIRLIFRKYKGKIYFIKIGNRENFYSHLNI